jgi:hypothetical protein
LEKSLRRRFLIEVIFASFTGVLALITPIFPDWIEVISGWDPDQHDGSVERLIVIALFLVAGSVFASQLLIGGELQ